MNQRGFTLLETTVALALTVVVLTTLRGIVVGAAAHRERVLAAADRIDRTRTALEQLTADVDATVAPDPTAPRRIELQPPPRGGTWPTLRITTATADALAETQVISYAVVAAPQPHLVRRGPFGEQTVLESVQTFQVRARSDGGWTEAWLDDQPPRALEIALAVDHTTAALRVIVPVPVGAWR